MIQTTHPIFEHDCELCTFLGAKEVTGELYDFYICQSSGSHIARYGSQGSDYLSLPRFLAEMTNQVEPFKTCIELLKQKGI
jgi:hypothetical protein